MTLTKWNFASPYLLCYIQDTYANGVQVYQESVKGNFTLIKGGGGVFSVAYLVSLGILSATANTLVSGLHD